MVFILIGHRGSGKTTLASAISGLRADINVIDLDEAIEARHAQTCAQLVAQDEPRFRQIERETLDELIAQSNPNQITLIVPGAGCMHLPLGPLYIWLYRDGWVQTAKTERQRLRPQMSWAQEVQWMTQTREPVWQNCAHLKLHVSRGTPLEHTTQDALTLIQWAIDARGHQTAQKTFIVPTHQDTFKRAISDVTTLGLGGVEIRSDFFETHQSLDLRDVTPLLSLRHDDPTWLLNTYQTPCYDIDLQFIETTLQSDVLQKLPLGTMLLSAHPKDTFDPSILSTLEQLADRFPKRWQPHLALKIAPAVANWRELQQVLKLQSSRPTTILPQGSDYAWTRPWLIARGNLTNYLPVGLPKPNAPTPYDYQAWLPHMVNPTPTRFDALVGQPVAQSIGDLWHRRASLSGGQLDRGYLKIPLPRDLDQVQWQTYCTQLHAMGIEGLSITSPFKRLVPGTIKQTPELEAANTVMLGERWRYTDTDASGLLATLEHLESRGIGPGTVAMIGHGGVSPAMTRALASTSWTLVHHARARLGWGDDGPQAVTLVINASGDSDTAYLNPPTHKVWLDLHYQHVRQPPSADALHLNGRIFFDAQAQAQRVFWHDTDLPH